MPPKSSRLPCFFLVGPADSGKSAILQGLQHTLSGPGHSWVSDLAAGVARWHFSRALVLEISGDLFTSSTNGNGKAWKQFLSALQKERPQRPMDGVILTVPCSELVGEHALSGAEWQRRAGLMSKNLQLAREQFGLSFPVYIVVTQCETIQGFQSFAATQLQANQREIFGWSNPYTLDAPFRPQWTAEAFAYVLEVLSEQRAKFFAQPAKSHDASSQLVRDDLLLLPAKFQALQAPVALFLDAFFRNSGHRDGLQFRGIYFSSHTPDANDAFTETARRSGDPRLAGFTADLFDHKIFPERGLARPVDTSLAPKNRVVYTAQALCAVAVILLSSGAGMGWRSLQKAGQMTLPHLENVAAALKETADIPQPEHAYDAIYAAQALSGRNFQSVFLPASMIDSLDARLQETMPPVFDKLVYPGLRSELEGKTGELLKAPSTSDVANPSASPEIHTPPNNASQQLAGFVDELLGLESNILVFNALAPAGAGNGQDMLTLATNLAPPVFAGISRHNSAEMDAVVRSSSGALFDGHPWNAPAIHKLEMLSTGVLRQRMNEDQLLSSIDALINQISLLEGNKLDTYEQLDSLQKSLVQVQTELGAKDLQWIAKDEFQLPDDLSQALTRIFSRPPAENVLLCDPQEQVNSCTGLMQLKSFIEQMARAHFIDFRAKLLAVKTTTTGNLIIAADGKLQLSPTAASLQTVLDNFLKLPFIAHQGTKEIQDVPSGQQLFWDSSMLQEALQDKAAYDKFFSDTLANTPDTLQKTFETVALDRLGANMVDAIASAQQFQALPAGDKADQATAAEARTFQAAAQSLGTLLDQFGELDFEEDYQDLLRVTSNHALIMLSRIDHAFDAQHFYWPPTGNFDRWTAGTLPTTAGYGTHSPEEMLGYLTIQRQNLQPYVDSAKPMVAFLQRSQKNQKQATLVAKWQGMVSDLQKFEAAPATSSLGSLEDYLTTQMDKTAPPDCQTSTAAAPAVPVYFAQTRRSLERAVYTRCRSLLRQTASQQYSQLADFFNQRLAGKFPFSASSTQGAPEADPADVIELFRRLDADGKAIHDSLQNNTSSSTAQIAAFVNQLESLRPLLQSLLTGQPNAALAFDFVPAFRANRGHEINGNQIIDWTLLSGNDAFRNSDPPRTGHWTFGQPFKLTLRWAKDSPTRPVPAAPAYGDAATKTVVFEYRDAWSLINMLVQHAAAPGDFDRGVDPDPQTLAFTIEQQAVSGTNNKPAKSGDTAGNPSTNQVVKIFIGIKLYAPGTTTGLHLTAFPTQAPTP